MKNNDQVRIQYSVRVVIQNDSQTRLVVEAIWKDESISLSTSSFLTFLSNSEKDLHPDDLAFSNWITKYLKKYRVGGQVVSALTFDRDIIWFFQKAKKYQVSLTWVRNKQRRPIRYISRLPIDIRVFRNAQKLVCEMKNQSKWLNDPLDWLSFKNQQDTLIFIQGKLYFNPPNILLEFLGGFLERRQIHLGKKEARHWIKRIYMPYRNRIKWRVQTDLSHFSPEENGPVPVIDLTLDRTVLHAKLSYMYGKKEILPDFPDKTVIDSVDQKKYQRSFKMEKGFQEDLIELYTTYNLPFMLENPGDIAVFLEKIVPYLKERNWNVRSDIENYVVDPTPVDLQFSVSGTSDSGFYFESLVDVDSSSFSLLEIARMMVENRGYLKTKEGFVKISDQSKQELETLVQHDAIIPKKKFNKAEILPLISASSSFVGQSEDASQLLESFKGVFSTKNAKPGACFKGDLRDYQQVGLNWMNFLFVNQFGGILADDMGLGKTVQTIAFASQVMGGKEKVMPALVIGPTNVVYNWESEITKFTKKSKTLVYSGANRMGKLSTYSKYDFVITSFGVLKNDIELLSKIPFRAIFVDEGQHMKNPNTQLSKAMKKLQAPFKLVMTGTPIENHLQDLWNLFDFVMPRYLGTFRQFDTYIKEGMRDKLKQRIKPFVLRREKMEVLDNLPEKTEITLKCTLSDSQKKLYQTVLTAARQGIRNSSGKQERLNVLTALLKLRQVCIHPALLSEFDGDPDMESAKFELLKEKLTELVGGGHHVVCFTQFTSMLDVVESWTKEQGINTERIDGSTSAKNRIEAVNRFQEGDEPTVFLISLKAGGVGINLTAADYVVHLDPWWNPAIEAQATDRVHRMGQKNKVFVYRFIAAGTIEEKIQKLQEEKKALLHEIIDIDSAESRSLDMTEIRDLITID